ncbi:hypothetical protein [Methylomonas albis]|uniref:Uncharacterized protein n=1 Tax=Methylomonas albis TaxID=1854563 RepID=A0ABR9CX87_9GAMM|nr:hypothetical protein [Methylomonas albis]MBD9355501.1 hypothetical protein [Methylomonas albis]
MSLINNNIKKFALIILLFFGFLSSSELDILFFEPPTFNQLNVDTGKIRINNFRSRTNDYYTLSIGRKNISFNCLLPFNDKPCISEKRFPEMQGKIGKAWWYQVGGTTWLYQLEVEGVLIMRFSEQIQAYTSLKQSYLYPWTILFFLSMLWFAFVQFANETKNPDR